MSNAPGELVMRTFVKTWLACVMVVGATSSLGQDFEALDDEADVDAVEDYQSFEIENDSTNILQDRLSELGLPPDYRVGTATVRLPDDMTSNTAIQEQVVFFREGFFGAIVDLISRETADSLMSEFKASTTNNLGDLPSNVSKCVADFEREMAERKRKDEEFKRSGWGTVERIFADKKSEDAEPAPVDMMIQCSTDIPQKQLNDIINRVSGGSAVGVRVIDIIPNPERNEQTILVGRSNESARDAGILRSMRDIQNPIPGMEGLARQAVEEMVKNYQSEHKTSPFIVGTQGFRIQDEMVYVGFSVATRNPGNDESTVYQNQQSRDVGGAYARTFLNEFAHVSANQEVSNVFEKAKGESITETLDMAKQGKSVKFEQALMDKIKATGITNLQASAIGKLDSAAQVFQKAYRGSGTPDFYLTAVAWSPSIQTNAHEGRRAANDAYMDGQRSGGNNSTSNGSRSSKPRTIKQDW